MFGTSFLHFFFFNRKIKFPLYLPIYMMNFSGQWITLFVWYLTQAHLIFAGQRRKTDWGENWGWTLFRWRVSFVPCQAFLMIGSSEEVTLRKESITFFHSSGTASNIRDRIHKIPGLGFLAGVSVTAGCDFWISEWRQWISSSDDTGL